MFSSIFALGVAHVPATDQESAATLEFLEPVPRPVFNIANKKKESESLLSVLDDKNRMISSLKKQLQNQKMQLTYYMNRELSRNKIQQLSESCSTVALEESMPLNLALNQFCKQTGIKTKLLLLHERMNRLELNMSNSLQDQEFILRKIVNKLCDFVKIQDNMSRSNFKDQFASFITDPMHVDLFNRLLTATLRLRRKLDGFKICCERILIIEEERNGIVEQVYSLPVEERIDCNYLVRIQMEKAELENEIKRISQHQATGRHRIKELNVIEKILHNLQWELNSSFLKNEESCISKMLKKINSEAQVLLKMTKEQKRKFECELSKTKCPEPDRVLFFINLASEADKFEKKDFDLYDIKTEEEIRFFEMVKVEIDLIKQKFKQEAEKNIRKISNECELLRGRVTEVTIDNNRTKIVNKSLRTELEELKSGHTNVIQRLKQERDVYKSQVEDLQAIREAYAQLVDKQPSRTDMERDFLQQIDQRDNKIQELEKFLNAQRAEIEGLKSNIADQNDQITVLNRFINLTRSNTPMNDQLFNKGKLADDTCSTNSTSETKFDNNSESEECYFKTTKSRNEKDHIFPRCRRYTTNKFDKKIVSPKYCTEPKNRMGNPLETLTQSDEESLSLFNMFLPKPNPPSKNIIQTAVSQSAELRRRVKTSKSSIFSMEIKYKNIDQENGLFESEDNEMLENISKESLVFENAQICL